jgi:hypothetical protein
MDDVGVVIAFQVTLECPTRLVHLGVAGIDQGVG